MKAVLWVVVVVATVLSPSGGQMTETKADCVTLQRFYICSRRDQIQQVRIVLLMLLWGPCFYLLSGSRCLARPLSGSFSHSSIPSLLLATRQRKVTSPHSLYGDIPSAGSSGGFAFMNVRK